MQVAAYVRAETVQRHYNLKWFGAKGDGTTDDTAAITKAYAKITANGGGTLYVPPGRYIDKLPRTPPKNIIVEGHSCQTSVFVAGVAMASMLNCDALPNNNAMIRIHNIGFDGNLLATNIVLTDQNTQGYRDVCFYTCQFQNSIYDPINIRGVNVDGLNFYDCMIIGSVGQCCVTLYLCGPMPYFYHCMFIAVDLGACVNLQGGCCSFRDCLFILSNPQGMTCKGWVITTGYGYIKQLIFDNCHFEGTSMTLDNQWGNSNTIPGYPGIGMCLGMGANHGGGGYESEISNLTIQNCWFVLPKGVTYVIWLDCIREILSGKRAGCASIHDNTFVGIGTPGNQDPLHMPANGILGMNNNAYIDRVEYSGNTSEFGNNVPVPDSMVPNTGFIEYDWNGQIVHRTFGQYAYQNQGINTFNGDGTTKVFTIPHGCWNSIRANVTPMSQAAAIPFYVTVNSTSIIVTFNTAPASGTNNIVLAWQSSI